MGMNQIGAGANYTTSAYCNQCFWERTMPPADSPIPILAGHPSQAGRSLTAPPKHQILLEHGKQGRERR